MNLVYFYALLAMACMYSHSWGLRNATDIQADLSDLGARRSVAPVSYTHLDVYKRQPYGTQTSSDKSGGNRSAYRITEITNSGRIGNFVTFVTSKM